MKRIDKDKLQVKKEEGEDAESLKLSGRKSSGSKKSSKYLDKSPTKKSAELSKIAEGPGNIKFTKDIADVAVSYLPNIVSISVFVLISYSLMRKYSNTRSRRTCPK